MHKYVHTDPEGIKRVCICGNFKRNQRHSNSGMIYRARRGTGAGVPHERLVKQSLESNVSVFVTLWSKETIAKANHPIK